MLKADVSAHARKVQYRELTCVPPECVVDVSTSEPARVPQFAPYAFGLSCPALKVLFGGEGHADWWDTVFELGRAPFAPIGRGYAPVCHLLIKNRAAEFRGSSPAVSADVSARAFATAASFVNLGANAQELGELIRAYAGGIPPSVVTVIAERDDLVGQEGALEPLGVIAGMVFATVTRVSYGARLKWLQALGSWRVSRMLRGMCPRA